MWARSYFHLWFCQWTRNRAAIHLFWAEGISSTFPSSTFLWRKVFSRLTSLPIFALVFFVFLIYAVMHCSFKKSKSWYFFHLVFTESRACCPPLWSIIVRVSDCTKDVHVFTVVCFSDSLVVYFVRILLGRFSCLNLSMYEIINFSKFSRMASSSTGTWI